MSQAASSVPPSDLAAHDLLRDAFDALDEGVAIYDAGRRLVTCNRRYREMLHEVEDLLVPGMDWEFTFRQAIERGVFEEATTGSPEWQARLRQTSFDQSGDLEVRHRNGRIYNVSLNPTASGGFVVTRKDVTEAKLAEEKARDRESLLATILDTIPVAIVMARKEDGHVIYRSREAEQVYGLRSEDARNYYVRPEDRAEYVRRLERDGRVKDYALDIVREDGTTYRGIISGRIVDHDGVPCVVTAVGDMTEWLEKEQLIRHVVEACPAPILMTKADTGQVLFSSPDTIELFGHHDYTAEFYVDPADRQAFLNAVRRAGSVTDHISRYYNAEGEPFWGAVSARLIRYGEDEVIVSHTRDVTNQVEQEQLIRQILDNCPIPLLMTKLDGGEILFSSPGIRRIFGPVQTSTEFYVQPGDRTRFIDLLKGRKQLVEHRLDLRNAEGEVFPGAISARLTDFKGEPVIVSHIRDITDQLGMEAELDRQREQVFQNEKMSALGSLLAGVAHELNNPLSVVVGHAMMLRDEATDPEVIRQTGKISDAAERCAKIVKTFLTMARHDPARTEDTDINAMIGTAVDVASYGDLGARFPIRCDLAPDLPQVVADNDQLTQVVINLLLNASQAIYGAGKGSQIVVRTRALPRTGKVEIVIEDDGPGIPKAIRPRIFEPFFTTKDVGEGTGIGLAFCHRIVTAHNGHIRLDDDYEGGARFVIELDAKPSGVGGARADVAAPEEKVAARVLVIDDERDVADLNAEVLERIGMKVDVAYSARDAFQRLGQVNYDAVISDLNMPDVDGRGFFDIIQSDFPDLARRTGFITGDTMGRASQSFLKQSGRPFIEKPVSPRELRAFVSDLAGAGDAA